VTQQQRRVAAKAREVVVLGLVFAVATEAAAHAASTDWEASGKGAARASFALNSTTTGTGKGRRTSTTISDLVVQAPIECTDSPVSEVPVDVEVIPATITLNASGAFTAGGIRSGSGTTVAGRITGRTLTLAYRHVATTHQFDAGIETCDTKTITLTGAPGRRVSVADATWEGQTKTDEPVALTIVAGGRALEEPHYVPANGGIQTAISFGAFTQSCFTAGCSPTSTDICAYETPTAVFINANGTFGNTSYVEGDQAEFTGRFTSARAADGTFMNGGEGCGQTTWVAGPVPSTPHGAG
jgi:hypothetical protein